MTSPSAMYSKLIHNGSLKKDLAQMKSIARFIDPLYEKVSGRHGKIVTHRDMKDIKGLYLWGGVGCGKTFLMDLLRQSVPSNINCCRMHFHQFMKDIHRLLHKQRLIGKSSGILHTALNDVVSNAHLLFFDEMMVTDIADAMLLKSIFRYLFDKGVCLITTSNRAPRDLYANGLNREQFLPFIDMIEEHCNVHFMDGHTDHREHIAQSSETSGFFFTTTNARDIANFEKTYRRFTIGEKDVILDIETEFGRRVIIPKAVKPSRVCRFSFQQLFGEALSAIDYETICQNFETVFIESVPRLSLKQTNEVRRLITALDIFYQYKVKLIILAHTDLAQLVLENEAPEKFQTVDVLDGFQVFTTEDEHFMITRTISRLKEMQSQQYFNEVWTGASV